MNYKVVVDNLIDSYNSYTEGARAGMIDKVERYIKEIDKDLIKTYQDADKKMYPLRNAFSEAERSLGENKRISASQFILGIAPNIKNVESEMMLLKEIQDAFNRNDKDYGFSLLHFFEVALPKVKESNSKLYFEINRIKEEFSKVAGVENIEPVIRELKTRKAEFQFILKAIERNDDLIVLPRQFNDMFANVDLARNEGLKQASIKLVNYANESMGFLTKAGASVKDI